MAVASSGLRFYLNKNIFLNFHLGTGEFLMKSLFSKSISDAFVTDDLIPETVRNHINNIFLSKLVDFNIIYK